MNKIGVNNYIIWKLTVEILKNIKYDKKFFFNQASTISKII